MDAAVRVFWEKGYEGASLGDLTDAIGLNRPSLYGAFKNKHGLFLEALDRYTAVQGRAQSAPLREETDMEAAVRGFYREIIRTVASPDGPCGCLIASVATEVAARDPVVRDKIAGNMQRSQAFLKERLVTLGGSSDADADLAAAMILTAGMSLAQRARLGATPQELGHLAQGYVRRFFHTPFDLDQGD